MAGTTPPVTDDSFASDVLGGKPVDDFKSCLAWADELTGPEVFTSLAVCFVSVPDPVESGDEVAGCSMRAVFASK